MVMAFEVRCECVSYCSGPPAVAPRTRDCRRLLPPAAEGYTHRCDRWACFVLSSACLPHGTGVKAGLRCRAAIQVGARL